MNNSEIKSIQLLSAKKDKYRIVIDTDTYNEIDDQFAIVQALLNPEKLKVEAIYAAPFSNERSATPAKGMELSYEEIHRLLEKMELKGEVLVYRGVTEYVGPGKKPRSAEAIDHLIQLAKQSTPEDPLYIVAIAAISNIASALLKAPEIIDRIVVVWLGGHSIQWNDTKEFNLRQDIGGAQVLFDSGAPIVLIPCNGVVTHLRSSVPEIERYVEPYGDIGKFLAGRFKEYRGDHQGWSKEIWDMAAISYLLHPESVESRFIPAPIVTNDCTWSFDHKRPMIKYVSWIERDIILKNFFQKLENKYK